MIADAYIFICPYCQSEDFWPEKDRARYQLWEQQQQYLCRDCGALFAEPICCLENEAAYLSQQQQPTLFVM